jgi:hypothetical protein
MDPGMQDSMTGRNRLLPFASRKAAIEALTVTHAGRVLSCEIIATGMPTSFSKAESNTEGCGIASTFSRLLKNGLGQNSAFFPLLLPEVQVRVLKRPM